MLVVGLGRLVRTLLALLLNEAVDINTYENYATLRLHSKT